MSYNDLGNGEKYNTIIDDQTSLNTKYSNFAHAYIKYVDCIAPYVTYNGSNSPIYSVTGNYSTCNTMFWDAVDAAAGGGNSGGTGGNEPTGDSLLNLIGYNAYIDHYGNGPYAASNGTMRTHIANANVPTMINQGDIDSSYNKVVNLRSRLDLKLQELYNTQNSIPTLNQSQHDSTVYSGILWTVLATTLIYYVFMKL